MKMPAIGAHLTEAQRKRIVMLREAGCKIVDICSKMDLSRKTVYHWLKRFESGGTFKGLKRQEYIHATTPDQDLAIIRAHIMDPLRSTRLTAMEFNVSQQTIRRRLHQAGLGHRIPAKPITEAQKRNRVNFCIQCSHFNWENNIVIFAGEKTFTCTSNSYGERLSLDFWGWMSSMGPGELIEIKGRMSTQQYIEALNDTLIPTVRASYGPGYIYVFQDKCSPQRGKAVRKWLETQPEVKFIELPLKSPDLNLIENVWHQMALNMDLTEVRNNDELKEVVFCIWELMRGKDWCWNLVAGMRERLRDVLDVHGGTII